MKNASKQAVFSTGITLAKRKAVKRQITHKEVTMIIGILIALVIAFTFWISKPADDRAQGSRFIPSIPKPPAIVKTSMELLKIR